jgi:hypothetical protein
MSARRVVGLLGSLFGLAMPLATLSVSSPLLGWTALGGAESFSFFWMEPPTRFHRADYQFDALSLSEPPCPPGKKSFRLLQASPLPRSGAGLPYDGLVACVLAAPDGRVLRVRILDREGKEVNDPSLAASIGSQWRFEVNAYRREETAWQRIRLDGLLAEEPASAH